MRVYYSDGFDNDNFVPDKDEGLWIYNGMDCCLTLEILNAIKPQLNEVTEKTYAHALELQGPILEMECRGIRVDIAAIAEVRAGYEANLVQLKTQLEFIMREGFDLPGFNFNSPPQMKTLFYEIFKLPRAYQRGTVTLNRKALEKFRGYFFCETIVNHILAIRDTVKKLGVLRTPLDADRRMRTAYNIAGTDTGRLSSYASAFGSGTNLQNITGSLRQIFIPDSGKKLGYIDLEQAESRGVGAIVWNLFHDGTYLDACESGDLHTTVTKMCWPNLPWTGDPVSDKKIAKQNFYRDFDYRDAAKRLGHGTNYFGQAKHMAAETRIPFSLVDAFQTNYLERFSGIRQWHEWTKRKLARDGWITSFMGRHRWFFGRRYDLDTLRAAIAYDPQSSIADYINRGLIRVWRSGLVDLLLQVHDAIVFQYDAEREDDIVPKVQRLLEIEVPLAYGRSLVIPTEAMVGWNWAYTHNNKKELVNPYGLVPFGTDTRTSPKAVSFMDRRLY
jgi:DNA polymerase I-like protein with 3'-5' exonuclease and polymerase domains